jgi:hypothetical protein
MGQIADTIRSQDSKTLEQHLSEFKGEPEGETLDEDE